MARARHQKSLLISVSISLAGCVALSSMIWIIGSDEVLANVFWPTDIHEAVIRALGGTTNVSVTGEARLNLPWLAVFVRVCTTLFSMAVVSVLLNRRRASNKGIENVADAPQGLTGHIAAIAFPWLYGFLWLAIWFLSSFTTQPSFLAFVMTSTPYSLALLLAASFSVFAGSCHVRTAAIDVDKKQGFARKEFLFVLLAMFAWEASSFWMNERLYAGLLVPHGDSAMYEEHLWNTWHGKGFRSYLDQGLFLGEHIQVIHLLLLPVHIVWPSYLMMELVASSSLAICVIPIYSIALRHSGSSKAAMWLALAWLCYFPMHYLDIAIDLKTLRPSCYGLPFLFWGIDLAERHRRFSASVCLLVAISTQEDFSLIVGAIGVVLFLTSWKETTMPERRRMMLWAASVFAFSVAYLLLAVLVVIPAFRGGEVVHYSRYFGSLGRSPGELVRNALMNPGPVLAVVCSFRTLMYLIVLSVPVGLLTWRRPVYLLAGVPAFLMLSLIQLGNESNIPAQDSSASTEASSDQTSLLPPVPYHHFHAPLLPVLFWAAAAGLKAGKDGSNKPAPLANVSTTALATTPVATTRLAERWRYVPFRNDQIGNARFAFFCALFTAVTGSMMPIGVNFWSSNSAYGWRQLYVPGPRAAEFAKVLADLPTNSRVASTDYVHTRLTHFERSYDYSDYPRAVNNYQPGVPPDTDYIVIDTSHPYSRIRSLNDVPELKTQPDQWDVLPDQTGGLFIVLKRRK